MERFLYSVFDAKSRVFSIPFTSVNKFTALRDFNSAASDPQSDINRYPEDYSLYELARFDDESGLIAPHPQPEHLGLAIQFKKPEVIENV